MPGTQQSPETPKIRPDRRRSSFGARAETGTRSRADRRSWLPIPASRYGGIPLRWAVTAECCGGAPQVPILMEARAKGAQSDGWFENPIGKKQGPIAGRAPAGVA
ncbi:hypothetical protein NDU88_004874 [Pleurodeles waltl]|uniref:Uncharacterized protein n=1 Tax=Pleurodeles waltl TaxID=8319 RepID=A0AAV7RHG1_PLEWA|nr:hypothetical protein NDU88_004874 [Pleurodeles waltl]